jgi:hypothetical protein
MMPIRAKDSGIDEDRIMKAEDIESMIWSV